jgi:hypothetical protein
MRWCAALEQIGPQGQVPMALASITMRSGVQKPSACAAKLVAAGKADQESRRRLICPLLNHCIALDSPTGLKADLQRPAAAPSPRPINASSMIGLTRVPAASPLVAHTSRP